MRAAGRLLSVAEQLADACPEELGREIAVTGSVGARLADELSDLELLFLVDRVPDPARAAAWLGSVGGIDVLTGRDVEEAEREVEELASGEVVASARLAFRHVVTHAIAVRSAGRLESWAARLASYPEGLQGRVIDDASGGWEIPSPRLGGAVRGDRVSVQSALQNEIERVLRLVFALNRRWDLPRWKWLAAYVPALAPTRLVQRVVEPLVEPNAVAAVRAATALVRDTLRLVPAQFDVTAAAAGTERRLATLEPM